MRRDVRGLTVLVCGASRGLGRRLAERLAARGARVAVTARSGGELEELAAKLRAAGADARAFAADLTDAAARDKLVADVAAAFGGLDVLVHSAGVASYDFFEDSSEEILRKVLEINFFAPAELTRAALPWLQKSAAAGQPAAVMTVSSICGRAGIPNMSEHAASKHAIVGLTEAWRAEFVRFGIDVINVLPGIVRTDDSAKHLLKNDLRIRLNFANADDPDYVADRMMTALEKGSREVPVGRLCWWACFGRRWWPRSLRVLMRRKVRQAEARRAVA